MNILINVVPDGTHFRGFGRFKKRPVSCYAQAGGGPVRPVLPTSGNRGLPDDISTLIRRKLSKEGKPLRTFGTLTDTELIQYQTSVTERSPKSLEEFKQLFKTLKKDARGFFRSPALPDDLLMVDQQNLLAFLQLEGANLRQLGKIMNQVETALLASIKANRARVARVKTQAKTNTSQLIKEISVKDVVKDLTTKFSPEQRRTYVRERLSKYINYLDEFVLPGSPDELIEILMDFKITDQESKDLGQNYVDQQEELAEEHS